MRESAIVILETGYSMKLPDKKKSNSWVLGYANFMKD